MYLLVLGWKRTGENGTCEKVWKVVDRNGCRCQIEKWHPYHRILTHSIENCPILLQIHKTVLKHTQRKDITKKSFENLNCSDRLEMIGWASYEHSPWCRRLKWWCSLRKFLVKPFVDWFTFILSWWVVDIHGSPQYQWLGLTSWQVLFNFILKNEFRNTVSCLIFDVKHFKSFLTKDFKNKCPFKVFMQSIKDFRHIRMLRNNAVTVLGQKVPRHLIVQKNILVGKILTVGNFS